MIYETYFSKNLINRPYLSNKELFEDVFAYLDMYIEIALSIKKSDTPFHLLGVVITDSEINNILESGKLRNRHNDLNKKIIEDIEKSWNHICSRVKISENIRLFSVIDMFEMQPFEVFLFIVGLSLEFDRKYEKFFGYLNDDINQSYPTLGLARALYSISSFIEYDELYNLNFKKSKFILFEDFENFSGNEILKKRIKVSSRILSFINNIDYNLKKYCEYINYSNDKLLFDID